jgi:WD40 repeat protein
MGKPAPEQTPKAPGAQSGLDAFVSYSRRDQDFVIGLKEALEQRGRNVWIDADDIPAGAPWRRELGTGIEAAGAFVFVISPDSIASPECAEELDRALALGKRLVPVLYRPAADVPQELAAIQYIDAEAGGSEQVVEELDQAITTDQEWVREHTEWLARALRWEGGGRDRSRLLRGSELDAAERWLTRAAGGKRPRPTALQAEYIAAGRRGERRRVRTMAAAAAVALAVSVALAVLALIARNDAIDLGNRARSGEVAARASEQLEVDPERSLLLALEARAIGSSPLADDALRRALPLSHVRAVMQAQGRPVSDLALSRDGDRLVTAARDGVARVFDPREGGRPIGALHGHSKPISTVELAPDGRRVITASNDGSARVWDLDEGRPLLTLRHDGRPIRSAAFSQDGERILTTGDDGSARVWDADSGRRLARLAGRGQAVQVASFSPDGRTVLTGGEDGTARLWNLPSGRGAVLTRYDSPVFRASFSRNGRRALTIDARGTARIWNTESRRLLRELGGVAYNGALSPDGSRVATTTIDGPVRLWDAEKGAPTRLFGHGAAVRAVAFSPDGELVATGGQDQTARVWDAEQGLPVAVLQGHVGGVVAVTFSSDGRSIVTGSEDGTARRWDVGGQIVLRGHGAQNDETKAGVNSAEMSGDGRTVLTAGTDGTARMWDARTGKEIKRPSDCGLPESASFSCLAAAVLTSHVSFINSAAFSPDGRRVASAGDRGTAFVHEARSGALITSLEGHQGRVAEIDYSPDGRRLVTAGQDATARVWDSATGAQLAVLRGHRGAVNAATFMPSTGRVATAGEDGTVRLWSALGGRPQRTFRLRGDAGVIDVAASPDGKRLAVPLGSTARMLDAKTGRTLTVISDHDGDVSTASFSPDGRTLVTGGSDLTARLFELPGGQSLGVLRGHDNSVLSAEFSPDGQLVVTGGDDGTARIFRCDLCGSNDDLIGRARRRVTRELSAAERRRFLSFDF